MTPYFEDYLNLYAQVVAAGSVDQIPVAARAFAAKSKLVIVAATAETLVALGDVKGWVTDCAMAHPESLVLTTPRVQHELWAHVSAVETSAGFFVRTPKRAMYFEFAGGSTGGIIISRGDLLATGGGHPVVACAIEGVLEFVKATLYFGGVDACLVIPERYASANAILRASQLYGSDVPELTLKLELGGKTEVFSCFPDKGDLLTYADLLSRVKRLWGLFPPGYPDILLPFQDTHCGDA